MIVSVFKMAGPFLFTAGVAAICAPNRILKGLGGVLISFAIVFYVALPVIPSVYAAITNNDIKALPQEFEDYVGELQKLKAEAGIFDLKLDGKGLIEWIYEPIVNWAIMCFLTGVLLTFSFAAARGLAQSIGGVSASV